MRYSPYTYDACRSRSTKIISDLEKNNLLLPESKAAFQLYLDYADPVQGKPIKGEWMPTNIRYGYQHDLPGLVGEILSQTCASTIPDFVRVQFAQDKITQYEHKIDFIATYGELVPVETPHQSKVIRFLGDRCSIEKYMTEGYAHIIDLVDIDDHLCYFINRELLESLQIEYRGYLYKWQLEANGTKFDMSSFYS
jgi:hypothetical protein